jgi:hypothetical protein
MALLPTILYAAVICLSTAACSETRLKDYPVKSRDERAIIAVLARYETAKNRFDVTGYLAGLHPAGRYSFGGDAMVSKKHLAEHLPEFWKKLRAFDPGFFPITRESVNGNFFESGWFVNPKIRIAGDAARVTMTFSKGFWHLDQWVSLRRNKGQWWIDRLDWEQN